MELRLGPPVAIQSERASRDASRWSRLGDSMQEGPLRDFIRASEAAPIIGPLLPGIFAGSPFLTECLLAEPEIAMRTALDGPDATAARLLARTLEIDLSDRARLMAQLRRARRRTALLVALADLSGSWPLTRVTEALTAFADASVTRAVQHLLLEAARRGDVLLPEEPQAAAAASGLVVLGMGKLGARELNYSSDIDLIILFDELKLPYRGAETPMAMAVRLTRALVHILEHRTHDGYVFRTDLRLRPHLPGHPLAISTDAAELYYERHGQNWERAAFVKARPVAGDLAAGGAFLDALRPYVWRRNLDYAAIRDIHSIKRQINTHRGFGEIRLLGHDLKVGRGGIREVEFFAQTQQLILGGREPELRSRRTCEALAALADHRWVAPLAATELTQAYRSLRALEHRLQMMEDKQTQALPALEDDFRRFAAFAGAADTQRFGQQILAIFRTVEHHYAALFESEPDLGGSGSLVFTGTDDDPETLATLAGMGFQDPAAIARRIRAWHHGHIRATRSTRARELLTELLPSILDALRRQSNIDEAFRLFDDFLTGLPAGVQIFSLLLANPRLIVLLADLVGAAPRLAPHLARSVDLFETLLQPDFFEPLPDRGALETEIATRLHDARDLEDTLDACRRWAHGRQFQAGLQVFLGVTDFRNAAATLTCIAEVVLATLLPVAQAWLEEQNGSMPDGSFAVLGLGKLGAGELTIGSDLDLIFLYDAPADARSLGPKPLPAQTFYARLGQRLVSVLSARTAEGQLYEIDTRLRPSGNVGPVACSLENFARYHEATAEIWEQQSLCRARVVAGDRTLARRIDLVIERALRRERDMVALGAAIGHMRERIFKEHGSESPWNLKYARGGLIDLEFAAQYLTLAHSHRHPELRVPSAAGVFVAAAEAGIVSRDQAGDLVMGLELQQALQMALRLSNVSRFAPAQAPQGLKEALLRAAAKANTDMPAPANFAELERRLVAAQLIACQFCTDLLHARRGVHEPDHRR